MISDKDWKELIEERDKLLLLKKKGSNLGCGCGNKGNFGAITKYTTKSGHSYKICGWCGKIS